MNCQIAGGDRYFGGEGRWTFLTSQWTLSKVVQHVKTAMLIELTTIPLYLYAAYSIDVNPDDYSNSGDASSAAEAKAMIIR